MIFTPHMASTQAPVIPPDATRALRKREKRARIAAVAARILGLVQLSECWREDAADTREARLDIEAPLFLGGPCRRGMHYGQMTDVARMDAAGGHWARAATCSACGSTVDRSEFVPASNAVAMDDYLLAMGGEG